jgi:hypothetical protein
MGDGRQSYDVGGSGFDLDALARRAVNAVTHLARRGMALAGGVFIVAAIASLGGFFLGIAALSGGIETVWIVVGGFFAALAITLPLMAIWRLWAVRRSATELIAEVRSLLTDGGGSRRTVIETVEGAEANQDGGLVVLSQQFFGMRTAVGSRAGDFRAMASALTAVTSFPGFIALATVVSFVFAGLSVLFAIALLL